MSFSIKRADWLLLIVATAYDQRLAHNSYLTPSVLQKSLFILGREHPNDVGPGFYEFSKDAYGPCCVDIYRDAEEHASNGLIVIQKNKRGGWKEYSVTVRGWQRAAELREAIGPDVAEYIADTLHWARGLSFQALVTHVFREYPEYREKAVFQNT